MLVSLGVGVAVPERSTGGAGDEGRELGREDDEEKIFAIAGFLEGGDFKTDAKRDKDWECISSKNEWWASRMGRMRDCDLSGREVKRSCRV